MYMSSIEYFRSGIDKPKRTPEEALENIRQFIKAGLAEISKNPETIEALKAFKGVITDILSEGSDYPQVGITFKLNEDNSLSYDYGLGLGISISAETPELQSIVADLNLLSLTVFDRQLSSQLGPFPVIFVDGGGETLFSTAVYPDGPFYTPGENYIFRLYEKNPHL